MQLETQEIYWGNSVVKDIRKRGQEWAGKAFRLRCRQEDQDRRASDCGQL